MEKIKEIVSLAQQLQASIDVESLSILSIDLNEKEIKVQLYTPSFLETFEDYERDASYSIEDYFRIYKIIEGVKFIAVGKSEEFLDIKKDHSAK